MRARKNRGKSVGCPFMFTDYPSRCKLCFEWMKLKWKEFNYKHPCDLLDEEEVKKRFWRNVGT